MESKRSRLRSTEVLVAIIGAAGVLGAAVITNWEKIFPHPTPAEVRSAVLAKEGAESTPSARQRTGDENAGSTSLPVMDTAMTDRVRETLPTPGAATRAEWARENFRHCSAGTWNVIVRSFEGDPSPALLELRRLAQQFPTVGFKVVQTVAADGVGNGRFAIWVGHGLSKSQAQALVAMARQMGVAPDAYCVRQEWESNCTVPRGWEVVE